MRNEALTKLLIIFVSINFIYDNIIINVAIWALMAYMILSSIIEGIKFKDKTFTCLQCENEFNLKWYQLASASWRYSKKYRRYKNADEGAFEKVYVKCPKCKEKDCIMK